MAVAAVTQPITRKTNAMGFSRGRCIIFLAGTHKLEICTMCIPEHKNGRSRTEKLTRIIRPSLELGDALLFNCRILHFGLANNSQQLGCQTNDIHTVAAYQRTTPQHPQILRAFVVQCYT